MKDNSTGNETTIRWVLSGLVLILAVTVLGALFRTEAAQEPVSAGPPDPVLLEDLVLANRILSQEGIVDGFGHVSVRHNANPERFLLAGGVAPELVTADDIVEYDLEATPINLGESGQYLERYIHSEIYKARPEVQAISHNHSPAVVPFGVSSVPLRPIYHMSSFIGEGIPVFDIRDIFGGTHMLVSDQMRGRALAETLADRPAVLMRGHGVSVVGVNLKFAVGRSIYLEINARLQTQAMSLGGDITYINMEETEAFLDEAGEGLGYERPWSLWKLHAMEQ